MSKYYLTDSQLGKLVKQGDEYLYTQNLSLAFEKYSVAYSQILQTYPKSSYQNAPILKRLGRVCQCKYYGQFYSSIEEKIELRKSEAWHYENYLELREKHEKSRSKPADIYLELGNVFFEFNMLDKSKIYYKKYHNIIIKQKDYLGLANILNNLGNVYFKQGFFDKAFKCYEKCREKREDIGLQNEGLAEIYLNLGNYFAFKNLNKALEYYTKCKNIRENIKDCYGVAQALIMITKIYVKAYDLDNAKKSISEAENIINAGYGGKLYLHTQFHIEKGNIAFLLYDLNEAIDEYIIVSNLLEKYFPNHEVEFAGVCFNLARVHMILNNIQTASTYFEKCEDLYIKNLPGGHPLLISLKLSIGNFKIKNSDYEAARHCYKYCKKYLLKNDNDLQIYLGYYYSDLALMHKDQGNLVKTWSYLKKTKLILKKFLKTSSLDLAMLYINIGKQYFSLMDFDKAKKSYVKAQRIMKNANSSNFLYIWILNLSLGTLYLHEGNLADAEKYIKSCFNFTQSISLFNPLIADAYLYLGDIYNERKKYEESFDFYKKCLNVCFKLKNCKGQTENDDEKKKKVFKIKFLSGENSRICFKVYCKLAIYYYNYMSNFKEALYCCKKAEKIYRIFFPTSNHVISEIYYVYSCIYKKIANYDESLTYAKKCKIILEKYANPYNTDIANFYTYLSELYYLRGEVKNALTACENAASIYRNNEKLNLFQEAKCLLRLSIIYFKIGESSKALENFKSAEKLYQNKKFIDKSDIGALFIIGTAIASQNNDNRSCELYLKNFKYLKKSNQSLNPELLAYYYFIKYNTSAYKTNNKSYKKLEKCIDFALKMDPKDNILIKEASMQLISKYQAIKDEKNLQKNLDLYFDTFGNIASDQNKLFSEYKGAKKLMQILDFESSKVFYSKALKFFNDLNLPIEEKINFNLEIGLAYKRFRDYDEAIEYFKSCEQLIIQNNQISIKHIKHTYYKLACSLAQTCNYEKTGFYAKKILEVVNGRDDKIKSLAFYHVGMIWVKTMDLSQALKYFCKSLKIRATFFHKKPKIIGQSMYGCGLACFFIEEFQTAKTLFKKSIKIFIQLKSKKTMVLICKVYAKLAACSRMLNKYDKAQYYYEKCENLLQNAKVGSSVEFMLILEKIKLHHQIYSECSSMESLKSFENKLKILNPSNKARYLVFQGLSYVSLKKRIKFYRTNISYIKQQLEKHPKDLVEFYFLFGKSCYEAGHLDDSKNLLSLCNELCMQMYPLGHSIQSACSFYLALICAETEDYISSSKLLRDCEEYEYNLGYPSKFNKVFLSMNFANLAILTDNYDASCRHLNEFIEELPSLNISNIKMSIIYLNLAIYFYSEDVIHFRIQYLYECKELLDRTLPKNHYFLKIINVWFEDISKNNSKKTYMDNEISLESYKQRISELSKIDNVFQSIRKLFLALSEHCAIIDIGYDISYKCSTTSLSNYYGIPLKKLQYLEKSNFFEKTGGTSKFIQNSESSDNKIDFASNLKTTDNQILKSQDKKSEKIFEHIPFHKSIVPQFSCSVIFPNIYNKSDKKSLFSHHNRKTQIEIPKIFMKFFKEKFHKWAEFLTIYKEIKLLKQLSKFPDSFPKIYYYCVNKGIYYNKIQIAMQDGGLSLSQYMLENPNLSEREMKILVFNLIKAYKILSQNNIVHSDVSPENILVESPEKVKLCDFTESFFLDKQKNKEKFPLIFPKKNVSINYLSPELRTWCNYAHKINCIFYDPFKSEIFSIGLVILKVTGIDITDLNIFDINDEIHIIKLLTVNYNYIVDDSLKSISYKRLKGKLHETIKNQIDREPYTSLKFLLKKMLKVDMVERADITEIYNIACFYMGKIN